MRVEGPAGWLGRLALAVTLAVQAACTGVRAAPTDVAARDVREAPVRVDPTALSAHPSRVPLPSRTPTAREAVSSFLRLANRRDITGMGMAFGTESGPLLETAGDTTEVEVRMEAIASILRHGNYRIRAEEHVAGSGGRAVRVLVDLTVAGRTVAAVPFVAVRTSGGVWLVREVDLAKVMAGAHDAPDDVILGIAALRYMFPNPPQRGTSHGLWVR